ncbi:hypothetical protein C8F04DRAFT_1181851 [Mycena alexandri]|uniref:Uncharacterized protein n=1 Tax=Mycena alexandri TaxID=1745969 RepID=A0AAD6SXF8_9AGAR|nr:hypothetical protein C8F04DRAFT_1181851 [Mycena alexandri]
MHVLRTPQLWWLRTLPGRRLNQVEGTDVERLITRETQPARPRLRSFEGNYEEARYWTPAPLGERPRTPQHNESSTPKVTSPHVEDNALGLQRKLWMREITRPYHLVFLDGPGRAALAFAGLHGFRRVGQEQVVLRSALIESIDYCGTETRGKCMGNYKGYGSCAYVGLEVQLLASSLWACVRATLQQDQSLASRRVHEERTQ